jgi:hypothetical protein
MSSSKHRDVLECAIHQIEKQFELKDEVIADLQKKNEELSI